MYINSGLCYKGDSSDIKMWIIINKVNDEDISNNSDDVDGDELFISSDEEGQG